MVCVCGGVTGYSANNVSREQCHCHMTLSVIAQVSPVTRVTGLRWGDYIGSPDHLQPVITWSSDRKQTAVKLAALSTGEVFGLDPFSTLLVRETGNQSINQSIMHF